MTKPTQPLDIYVRVSRVGGRENLISPDEQERRGRNLAKQHGLQVGRVLIDLDESGGKLDRPGLQEALARVEAGESGGVIVAWLDRLSRDSEHAHGLLRRIDAAGGVLYAPDAPADMQSPEGELQLGILFAFAQYVRTRARAGLERAKENAIAEGIPVATRPPAGYVKGPDRRLIPDENAAPVVAEAFRLRARGSGPSEIAAHLEQHGVRTSQGSATWSKPAIYGLLKNRVYLGELSYGKRGSKVRADPYVNPTAHAAIIDAATFEAAQHPNGRNLAPARSEESPYLLSGILRCSACRYALQGTTTSRGKRIYRCTVSHSGGRCPAPARVDAEPIESRIADAFWDLLGNISMEATTDDLRAVIADLDVRAETSERAYVQWRDDASAADEDYDEYKARLRVLRQRRDDDRNQLGQATAQLPTATSLPSSHDLRKAWPTMTPQERRGFVSDVIDTVAVTKGQGALVVYPAGNGPTDLPRRGFTRTPVLRPFDAPPKGARVLAL